MNFQTADLIIPCSQMSQHQVHMAVITLMCALDRENKGVVLKRKKDKSFETSHFQYELMTKKP